ncbi:MAG: hypothetical protein AAF583_01635 [Pseudomonadota bacterium]
MSGILHQPSLAGGEISPSLHGRVDISRYLNSLATAKNVIVLPEGGIAKRAGTALVEEARFSSRRTRLVEFRRSNNQEYILEFGHQYMRVTISGGLVLDGSPASVTDATNADPCVVTTEAAHGFSDGDVVYIDQVGGAVGMRELIRRQFVVSGSTSTTFNLLTLDGLSLDATGFSAFEGSSDPVNVPNPSVQRVYQISTPYSEEELFDLRFEQSADVMYITHPSHSQRTLSRTSDTSWTLAEMDFGLNLSAPQVNSGSWSDTSQNPFPDGFAEERYVVTSVSSVTGDESSISGEIVVYRNSLWTAGQTIDLSWQAATSATDYNVYKLLAGVYGFVGTTSSLSFADNNILADTADTPPVPRDPFDGSGNNPACAAFFEDRLMFAGSNNNPQTVNGSRTSNYDNHGASSPPVADDAVEFTINARRVNRIDNMLDFRDLLLFTTGVIYAVSGQGERTPISANAPIWARKQTFFGATPLEPLEIGETALYVEDKNNAIRDLFYEFSQDGYTGSDLSIMARHLFDGRDVIDWAFARAPDSIVWCCLDDGTLLSMTYIREHQISAWTRHEVDGLVESVAAVSEELRDVPYFVVRRTINGTERRFIERLEQRTAVNDETDFYVDCGRRYSGTIINGVEFDGLWHLEGKEVAIMIEGQVLPRQTVLNGRVFTPDNGNSGVAVIGLPYEAEAETLELNTATDGGPLLARKRRMARIFLQVNKTRGIFIGRAGGELEELKQRLDEPYGSSVNLETGTIEITPQSAWEIGGRVQIKSLDPLPMEILSIMPEMEVGG